jgi:hypothetical protein
MDVCRGYYLRQTPQEFSMTVTARKLLAAFDALPPNEQQQVAAKILRRTSADDDLPEAAFDELAAELFRGYGAEEAASAAP